MIFNSAVEFGFINIPDNRLCTFDSFAEAATFETPGGPNTRERTGLASVMRGVDIANLKWLLLRHPPGAWDVDNGVAAADDNPNDPFLEILRFRSILIMAGNTFATPFQSVDTLPLHHSIHNLSSATKTKIVEYVLTRLTRVAQQSQHSRYR